MIESLIDIIQPELLHNSITNVDVSSFSPNNAKPYVGRSVLFHADCFDILSGIKSKSVNLILCDLPYGTTQNKWDIILPLDKLWKEYERLITDNGAIILTASQPFTSTLIMSNTKLFKYDIVWHKRTPSGVLNAKKMPIRTHETILVFYKKLPTYNFQKSIGSKICGIKEHKVNSSNYRNANTITPYIDDGSRFPTSVLDITGVVNNSKEKLPHPTQKPLALMEYLVKTYSNEDDIVLDNCMGSNTTGLACKRLNRQYIGIEKEKAYYDISVKRLAETLF
jgi:DNA modification methylase